MLPPLTNQHLLHCSVAERLWQGLGSPLLAVHGFPYFPVKCLQLLSLVMRKLFYAVTQRPVPLLVLCMVRNRQQVLHLWLNDSWPAQLQQALAQDSRL